MAQGEEGFFLEHVQSLHLSRDKDIVLLADGFVDVRDKGVVQVTQTTGFPVCLDPCKVRELEKSSK